MSLEVFLEFKQLTSAVFVERPNRFVVRCRLGDPDELVEAHLADPGRLKELLVPGANVYLLPADKPGRKTKWSVLLAEAPDGKTLVSVQSTLANRIAEEALRAKAVHGLEDWELQRAEYSLGSSRWDFLLAGQDGKQLLLEVKSCTLVEDQVAMFPDAVTARGRRHLEELTALQAAGEMEGAVLFVVQRSDAEEFRPAEHIDPAFAQALRGAVQQGVRVFVHRCAVDLTGIRWGKPIQVNLS